ncbi:hypothetical protein [Dokdonella immobilis]|uniref:Uncharacterized protein n=1 Tax=Dokdonella immobilis TaxID=578942 RepID=A0A1I4Y7M8_9GAMM|nr:hypothetical protein [Dokdonella immobilis]SFN33510.1 hypothetical protein SAMN05216289_11534 [Dokdonella immobilis]
MISCIFAYAKGAESQSTAVEFVDPMSALFLVKNDRRARDALSAWLAQGRGDARHGHEDGSDPASFSSTPIQRAA